MDTANLLTCLAFLFIALGLACVVLAAVRHPTPDSPSFRAAASGYSCDDLEALTRRAEARAAADPHGLRRPLLFCETAAVPSARCEEADGGDLDQPGAPAIRFFHEVDRALLEATREVARHV